MKRIVHTVSIILAVLLAAAGGYYGEEGASNQWLEPHFMLSSKR